MQCVCACWWLAVVCVVCTPVSYKTAQRAVGEGARERTIDGE